MKKTKKTLMLCAVMALMISMPVSAIAQIKMAPVQNMFGNENRGMMGRGGTSSDATDYGIGNQGFGQTPEAPLGSGVLMLVAAGAGYAVIKSKKSDK